MIHLYYCHFSPNSLSFNDPNNLGALQDVTFSLLRVLELQCGEDLNVKHLTNFLEIHGKNLEELYLGFCNNSLYLDVVKFCPNLKSLNIPFNDNEMETLKEIFNSYQQLKRIKVWCGDIYLNGKRHKLRIFQFVVEFLRIYDIEI